MKQKRSGGERYMGSVFMVIMIGMVVVLVSATVAMIV
jgi:hypothetical protein